MSAHTPVLLHETVENLNVRGQGVYVDCTFGRGGHSRLILAKLGPDGRLVAIDRDPHAVRAADALDDPRFTIIHGAFGVGSSRVDLQACKLEYSIVSPK